MRISSFFVEKSTGRNPFSFLGGVNPITAMREGRLRCQGAFAHPIIAGTFWAMTLPWLILFWFEGRSRLLLSAGLVCSLFIIYASSSSTPVMCVLLGIVGALLRVLDRDDSDLVAVRLDEVTQIGCRQH